MLPPEIVDNPDLSTDEKIGRLRNLDANLRSLHRALYAPGETPWLAELAEIEACIRSLQQRLPSSPGTTAAFDRCRHGGDQMPRQDADQGCRRPPLQGADAVG
ncbi:hypothetical protein [Aminobacter aminovorans]|uniref:hypothetical protein n=1 Tax=Aminobacter aminovorans TaxID=83263 RepID=UPI00104C1AAD|nr:hypothetical protein [Aminobacter aminovorans]